MKIAVCIKSVPDTTDKITINKGELKIEEENLNFILNPYDEYAVEEALRTKEKNGAEVIAITLGKQKSKEALKKAMAMGADKGILLLDNSERDAFQTAKALFEELKKIDAELIFFGKASADMQNSTVGTMVAEMLNFNLICRTVGFNLELKKVNAECELEDGREKIETELPSVVITEKGLNEPRYPSLKGIISVKKKTIEVKELPIVNNFVETFSFKKPERKKEENKIERSETAIKNLTKLLIGKL